MKKIILMLAVAAFAAAPAAAATKHKKAAAKPAYNSNEASWRFVKNGLPLILPSWLLPVYFSMHKDAEKNTKKHTKKM